MKKQQQEERQISPEVPGAHDSFGAIFQYATEGILLANDKGDILEANPACEKMFGYSRGELAHKK